MIGTLTIAYGLKDKIVEFKGHGFMKQFYDHLKEFPLRKIKRNVNINANLTLPHITASGRIKATIKPEEDDLKGIP